MCENKSIRKKRFLADMQRMMRPNLIRTVLMKNRVCGSNHSRMFSSVCQDIDDALTAGGGLFLGYIAVACTIDLSKTLLTYEVRLLLANPRLYQEFVYD